MNAEFINPFSPKLPIELQSIAELSQFEDVVAVDVIDPHMTKEQRQNWASRVDISNFIAPRWYHGTLTDIVLTPMDDPFAVLRNAPNEGWRLPRGSASFGRGKEENQRYKAARCLGFALEAVANSTGRRGIGQLKAGLWFYPVSKATRVNYGGCTVNRVVSVPKIENQGLEELRVQSERIALAALKRAIAYPIRGGLSN
jgi:hypothetical protein